MTPLLDWFDDSGNAALAALVVSAVSVVVAVISLRKSSKTQRRFLEIEESRERDRVVSTKRANLVAEMVKEPADLGDRDGGIFTNSYLRIENKGQAEGRAIEVLLDGVCAFEHPVMLKGQHRVNSIGPLSSFRYTITPSISSPPPEKITLSWTDDSGTPGRYESTLT